MFEFLIRDMVQAGSINNVLDTQTNITIACCELLKEFSTEIQRTLGLDFSVCYQN